MKKIKFGVSGVYRLRATTVKGMRDFHLHARGVPGGFLIEEGVHALTGEVPARLVRGFTFATATMPAIVPKGAEYCVGQCGDIVASEVIIFKDVEVFKGWLKENPDTVEIVLSEPYEDLGVTYEKVTVGTELAVL